MNLQEPWDLPPGIKTLGMDEGVHYLAAGSSTQPSEQALQIFFFVKNLLFSRNWKVAPQISISFSAPNWGKTSKQTVEGRSTL